MTPSSGVLRTDQVLPRYGEASLADLLPSALGALGVAGEQDVLGLPQCRSLCLLVVDGLGGTLLRSHPAEAPFLTSLPDRRLTSGVPSTTAASLVSIGTGLPPGRHGLVGYTSRVPGTDLLLNALRWDQPVDPLEYQPHPTVLERAAQAGVAVTAVSQRRFRTSGLTRAGLRGGTFVGADTLGERVASAASAAVSPAGTPALVYVYEGDLDLTGHRLGCGSAAWRHQLAMVDRFAEELYEALPRGCVLVVTGDHGMLDVPFEGRLDVDDVPALREGVALVGGEARLRHVYARDGAGDDVLAAWQESLGTRAAVLTREAAIAAGWFGAVEARVAPRIGDVVVACGADLAVELRSVFPAETTLLGLHGSLSEDEMVVPLLVAEA